MQRQEAMFETHGTHMVKTSCELIYWRFNITWTSYHSTMQWSYFADCSVSFYLSPWVVLLQKFEMIVLDHFSKTWQFLLWINLPQNVAQNFAVCHSSEVCELSFQIFFCLPGSLPSMSCISSFLMTFCKLMYHFAKDVKWWAEVVRVEWLQKL